MADVSASNERVIIPVNGRGVIDEDEAAVILGNEAYKAALENRDVLVELQIKNSVTHTTPSFWQQLLNPAYRPFINERDHCADPQKLGKIVTRMESKLAVQFEQGELGASEIPNRKSEITHRFVGVQTDYIQCVSYLEMALSTENHMRELSTPERPLDHLRKLANQRRQTSERLRRSLLVISGMFWVLSGMTPVLRGCYAL